MQGACGLLAVAHCGLVDPLVGVTPVGAFTVIADAARLVETT